MPESGLTDSWTDYLKCFKLCMHTFGLAVRIWILKIFSTQKYWKWSFAFDKSGAYRGSKQVSVTSEQVTRASFTDSATQYEVSEAFQIVCTWTQATPLQIWKNTKNRLVCVKLLKCNSNVLTFILNVNFTHTYNICGL